MTTQIAIGLGTVLLLAAISALCARWLTSSRLAMQWNLRGDVNWTAPRRIALIFTPVLGAAVMAGAAVWADSHAELVFVAALLIGAHLLHMGLLLRAERRHR